MKTNLCGTHFLLIWLIAALFISGCGPVISQEVRKEADQTIGFEELLANPDAYRGRTVLLGGVIAGSVNKEGWDASGKRNMQEDMIITAGIIGVGGAIHPPRGTTHTGVIDDHSSLILSSLLYGPRSVCGTAPVAIRPYRGPLPQTLPTREALTDKQGSLTIFSM